MSSFSCPHLNLKTNLCSRIEKDCVPGRTGCVLSKKVEFIIPAEKRIRKNTQKSKSSNHEFY
ncbi:MAG: hypothetical protein K9J12_13520 [Melioribacteraceae bacterium]|nr:hypothetical protein [Melioribacteraceae bacterium]MCF8263889.1 hypothetical protein [Melioribacteraceae bacterium]MCF8430294.1 hypothetical protein [Melioribacteraceae bacterium]